MQKKFKKTLKSRILILVSTAAFLMLSIIGFWLSSRAAKEELLQVINYNRQLSYTFMTFGGFMFLFFLVSLSVALSKKRRRGLKIFYVISLFSLFFFFLGLSGGLFYGKT